MKMMRNLLIFLTICYNFFTILNCIQLDMEKMALNENGQFIDSFGRFRLFRGVNNVQKSPPWFDQGILLESKLAYYQDWGFNFVRLGCMWSGVYPQRDQINATYIQIMQTIVDKLGSHGLYSLLDMHQDIISSKYESYDGVPRWLIDSFPPFDDYFKYPFPFKTIPPSYPASFEGYFTYAVGQAFQDLYKNTSSALAHWGNFWTTVSKIFGETNSVIGYELINEPWAGNVIANPLLMLPGYAGRNNLLPAYDYLVKEIRKIDRKTLIFYEPVTWAYYFPGDGNQGTGFDHVPGGNDQHSLSVMSYHFYCWLIQSKTPSILYPPFDELVCDDVLAREVFRSVKEDQKQLKMGLFFTEFGSCVPDGNNKSINTLECRAMLDLADEHLESWSYWNSEFFTDNDQTVLWESVKTFARPYPIATAGKPIKLQFNYTTTTMQYDYIANTSISAPTIIYLPINVHYNGTIDNIDVTIIPREAVDYSIDGKDNQLIIQIKQTFKSYLSDFLNIRVIVKPKLRRF